MYYKLFKQLSRTTCKICIFCGAGWSGIDHLALCHVKSAKWCLTFATHFSITLPFCIVHVELFYGHQAYLLFTIHKFAIISPAFYACRIIYFKSHRIRKKRDYTVKKWHFLVTCGSPDPTSIWEWKRHSRKSLTFTHIRAELLYHN